LKFHPAAQILTWCLLVATLQVLAFGALLAAAGIVLLCAFALSRQKFIHLVRRTRWIMLSLLVIYAFSTPGQPLLEAFGAFSPSREGLSDGVLQLTRLLAALAGLALLLDRMHRQQLISGLYTLCIPLRWLGMPRERIAVRLALTLQYAEVAMLRGRDGWQGTLVNMLEQHAPAVDRMIELPLNRFALTDALLVCAALLMFLAAWI
jgi:energy-coupling factor transport system permease protein